jgi:hypothetical protein
MKEVLIEFIASRTSPTVLQKLVISADPVLAYFDRDVFYCYCT